MIFYIKNNITNKYFTGSTDESEAADILFVSASQYGSQNAFSKGPDGPQNKFKELMIFVPFASNSDELRASARLMRAQYGLPCQIVDVDETYPIFRELKISQKNSEKNFKLDDFVSAYLPKSGYNIVSKRVFEEHNNTKRKEIAS